MAINKCFLAGRVTRDAELKTTGSGMAVLTFGIAVNDRKKNQQTGQWDEVPNFFDCVMMGKRANAIAQYITKGTSVSLEGKLHWSSWERDGQKRSKVEIYVDEIEFMSHRQQGQYTPQRAPQGQQFYPNQAPMGYQQEQPQYDLARDLYGTEELPF